MCDCPRLHVDELGWVGVLLARIAEVGLDTIEARDGALPSLPQRYTDLVKLLAAGSDKRRAAVRVFPIGERVVGSLEAARLLGLSPRQVQRLAASGRFAGAYRAGERAWLIPVRAIEDYGRARAAA